MSNINNLDKYIKNGKLKGFQLIEFNNSNFVCKLCGNIFNIEHSYGKKGSWCIDCHKFDRKCKYLKNKNKIKKQVKKYDKLNPDNIIKRQKYYQKTEKYKKVNAKNQRKMYKTSVKHRVAHLLRSRLRSCFISKRLKKSRKFFDYIGCDFNFLKQHLESKFTEGMTWENQGKWHIDHIIPLSSGKTVEELYKLNHYTNLQPLWAIDNIKKGGR